MTGLEYLNSLASWRGVGGFGVDKLRAVMAELNNPQDAVLSAHIAGTNGKGSVSAAFSSMLGASGAAVLLNTSPHLIRVNERICVDGIPVSDIELNWAVELIRATSQQVNITLSHFEVLTAAAFLLGKERQVDWGVFEVGLGGRLDATNILKSPKISAIVSIDLDHEAILGPTLPLIAVEKAGIIKPNVPVVVGKVTDQVRWEIAKIAAEREAPIFIFGVDFWVEPSGLGNYKVCSPALGELTFAPSLRGQHQVENMSVAAVMGLLAGLDKGLISRGISTVRWPARLSEYRIGSVRVIFDAAHNPAGAASLISFLDTQALKGIKLIFGALKAKRWQEMVRALIPYVGSWLVAEPDSDDAVPANEVLEYLSGFGISGQGYCRNYLDILNNITCAPDGLPVLVTGSLYMVGGIMEAMGCEIPKIWSRSESE